MPSLSNISVLEYNVDQSKAAYLKLKGAHTHHRKQYLLRTQRTNVWHQEQRRKQCTQCNSFFGKRRMRAIDRVEFRDGSDLVQVCNKTDVEAAIMKENTGRFKLAYSSPFLNDNLLEQLGISGEGPLVGQILKQQQLPELDPTIREVFLLFATGSHSPISSVIALEEWIDHWRSVDERTASSYSGLHYGHYKAYTFAPEVAAIKCKIVNLSLRNGILLAR